jgi:M6 family metalloprotease-like protein
MTGAGFPEWNSLTPKNGKVKWALIPLDFVDIPGQTSFRGRVDDQMKKLSDWYATVSEGKLIIEWVVLDQWVRMPGRSSDYAIETSNNIDRSTNGLKLWNTAMTQSDLVFDFTGIQTVNFLLPLGQTFLTETAQGFPWDPGVRNFNTNEGRVDSFSMPGVFMDQAGREYWSYWAHEFGHAIGLPHVGSSREANPFQTYDLMGTQDGPSRELSGWLRFFGGWLEQDRIYCQDVLNLKSVDITLVPLSGNERGKKVVIVPVTETKTLVIESRRVTRFDCTTPTARNGVLAYIYDSTLGHGEPFLIPISPAIRPLEKDSCGSQNFSTPPTSDVLMREGETITVEGIKVEFLLHGNLDRIRISKTG